MMIIAAVCLVYHLLHLHLTMAPWVHWLLQVAALYLPHLQDLLLEGVLHGDGSAVPNIMSVSVKTPTSSVV